MALILVATLAPRALADDSDSSDVLALFETPVDEPAEPPSAAPTGDRGADRAGEGDAVAGDPATAWLLWPDATDSGRDTAPPAQVQPDQDADPLSRATSDLQAGASQGCGGAHACANGPEHHDSPAAAAATPDGGGPPDDPGAAAGASNQATSAQHQPAPAGQNDQPLGDTDECADGGCSTEPDLIVAAAGGGASGGNRFSRALARLLQALGLSSPQPTQQPPQEPALEYPQPRRLEPLERDIQWDIIIVEHRQDVREAQGLNLDQEEQWDAEVRLARAFEGIRQLQPQVTEGTPGHERLLHLTRRAERAALQLLTVNEPRPWGQPTPIEVVEWNIRAVESLQEVRAVEGRTRVPEERRDDQFRLARALEGIRQLRPQVAEGPESDRLWLAELTDRAQRAQRQLTEEAQRQATRGNPMSMVEAPQSLVTPPTDARTPQIPKLSGYAETKPQLPDPAGYAETTPQIPKLSGYAETKPKLPPIPPSQVTTDVAPVGKALAVTGGLGLGAYVAWRLLRMPLAGLCGPGTPACAVALAVTP
jgi:hypothetical protein